MFCDRFSGDVGCRERMYGLIVRIAQKYKDNQKQSEFIIDFLRLDVPNLLQINAKPTIEKKICEHCSNFLHSFFRKNGLGYNILAQVRSVQVRSYILLLSLPFYSTCLAFIVMMILLCSLILVAKVTCST